MTISRLIISSLAALACTFGASYACAHGDPEIPLYVAEDGLDSGRCDNQQAGGTGGAMHHADQQRTSETEILMRVFMRTLLVCSVFPGMCVYVYMRGAVRVIVNMEMRALAP